MSLLCFKVPNDAISYAKNSTLQYRWGTDLLVKCVDILENGKVMDVGCGDGKITSKMIEIQPKIHSILGIDGSESQIAFATEHHASDKIKFQVMKLDFIDFTDEFDVIFGCCIFHWVPDQAAIFSKIYKALKYSGKFIFVGPAANKSNISVISEELSKEDKWKSYFVGFNSGRSYHTPEEYRTILTGIGFTVSEIKETITKNTYSDIQKLKDWIRPLSVYAMYLPEHLREDFIDDIVKVLFCDKVYIENDGSIIMNSLKVEVLCAKL